MVITIDTIVNSFSMLFEKAAIRALYTQVVLILIVVIIVISLLIYFIHKNKRSEAKYRKLENAFHQSENRYKLIFENSSNALFISEEDMTISLVNSEYERISGYSKNEITGKKKWTEFIAEEDIERLKEYHRLRRINPESVPKQYECKIKDRHGNYKDIVVNTDLIPGTKQAIISFFDITERKKIEKVLKELEYTLNSILKTIPDIIYRLDPEGKITFISKAIENYGYTVEELIGTHILDIVHPEDRTKALYRINERRTGKRKTVSLEVRLITREKKFRHFEVKSDIIEKEALFVVDAEGLYKSETPESYNFIGTQGVARDITERKNMEKALRDSEKKYRNFVENSTIGVCTININAEVIYANQALLNLLGFNSIVEINRFGFKNLYKNSRDRDDFIDRIKKVEKVDKYEMEFFTKSGETIHTLFAAVLEGDYITGMVVDITDKKRAEAERKKLEKQLYHSQKMELVGRLAGGVAHDFNNILAGILGYSEVLKEQFTNGNSPERKAIEQIYENTVRATKLTNQLLCFSRKETDNTSPLDINKVIESAVRLSEKIFDKNIQVTFRFQKDIYMVEANENQIHQVFANLIINARDAMPKGGTLSFKTENVYLNELDFVTMPLCKPGNYVMISVTDTGTGISPEIKERIFEPFFTTKGKNEGTGLGLSIVYQIIKNYKGYIKVYSEKGKGTTFTIYLPGSKKRPKKKKKAEKVMPCGNETILVVDDEEPIREIVKIQLERLGYTVKLAVNGIEAVEAYSKENGGIDLVLLDMTMPKLSGMETYKRLKNINPDVNVLMASGYSQELKAKDFSDNGISGFIQKPFGIVELSNKISETLHKNS